MSENQKKSFRIAIIVRTKDRPRLLARCLQSIAEQTRLPDEVVVVNDGGGMVEKIVQTFANLHLRLINNDTNQGRAQAGNQGVQATSCEVIGFLDDDDRLLPDHLQRLENAMWHFDAKVVYSGCRLLQRDLLGTEIVLREQAIGEFNEPFEAKRLRYENYIPMINLLIDRQLWLEVGGFDESFEIFEDWDLLWRLAARTSFYHVNCLTAEYSIWGSSQITQALDRSRWLNAYQQFLEKHLLPLSESEGLACLAEYWLVSQERRGLMRERTEDKRSLQLQLIQNQQTVAEARRQLAEYQSHYERVQQELRQSQIDWQTKYAQLQQEYTQLQSNWAAKYEQSQTDWSRRYETLQAEWSRKYDHLQSEHHQVQGDWGRKYEQAQSDWNRKYEQLHAEWTRKYEKLEDDYRKLQTKHEQWQEHSAQQQAQLQAEWRSKYEHLQEDWRCKYEHLQEESQDRYEQLQTEWSGKYAQWQLAYQQQETHFKQQQADMLREIDKNIALYHQLQTASQQDRECCQTFHSRFQELHHQLAIGLTQATLTRILSSQPPFYANLAEEPLRLNYQRLVTWCEKQQQTWRQEEDKQRKIFLKEWQSLQESSHSLREALQKLTNKATRCRWLPYKRNYDKLLDVINELAARITSQVTHALNQFPKKTFPGPGSPPEIPPPRQVTGLYPSVATFAGNPPQVMDYVSQRGELPFQLGSQQVLVFKTYCTLDNFFRMDLALATYLRINHCHLRIIIREGSYPIRIIQVNAMSVLDNLFHPVYFEPIAHSAGKFYQIEIDSPDANEHHAVALWCHQVQPALPVKEPPLPTQLPYWLQQGFFDYPFAKCFTQAAAEHVFMVLGVVDLLSLQIFLRRLEKLLERAETNAQVVICGEISTEIRDFCEKPPFFTLSATALSDLLNWLPKSKSQTGYVWFCQVQTLPQLDAIEYAQEIFRQTKAALVVPAQIQTNGTISAAYALIDNYANLHHFPVGANIHHPYHGYRRTVEAASSPLIILDKQHLDKIDNSVLNVYKTPAYQVTDLIWQLKAQQFATIYDSALSYQHEQSPWNLATSEDDRQLFWQRWQPQLPTSLLISQYALLNPHQLPSILIIDATLPAYDEDSGSLRLFTLMKMMGTLGYQVTFFPDNLDSQLKYRQALHAIGVEVFHGPYTIAEALTYRSFDFAIVCRVEIGHRYLSFLRLVSPRTKIFYDTVDIHYIRELRQGEIENNSELTKRAQTTKRKELANCLLADTTLTVTEEDAHHLRQEVPHLEVAVLPNVHSLQPYPTDTFEQRDGLVFIGNYHHQPNEDAVFYFVDKVFPLIQARLPDVSFYILGSHLKETMKALAAEKIKVIGWVDKVEPEFAKRRLFVSYLRYGAGMKGKIGQALSLGLPVVTTSMGAEGMGLVEAETALIADDPDQFAQAVCRLYTDRELWEKLSRQGRDYIQQHFGEDAVQAKLQKLLVR